LILPVRLRRVAPGLMIEKVRSLAMVSFLVRGVWERPPDSGLAKWSLAYIQLAAPPQRPGNPGQVTSL
jgi:hypothetical protein